jgi:acyl-CoA thioesterase
LDAARALVVLDTLCWPPIRRAHLEENYVALSLDLTAWFHRPGSQTVWLLGQSESPVAARGVFASTCRIFDEQRRLLASGGGALMYLPAKT